jgi:hypothetical protein
MSTQLHDSGPVLHRRRRRHHMCSPSFDVVVQPKWAIIVVDNVEHDTRVHHPVSWFPGLPRWWQRMAIEAGTSAPSSAAKRVLPDH